MADLISPGVDVQIIDESFFIPGRVTTLPIIFIATADEKLQPDGETPALGTYEYGVFREVTSIRQSLELYGIPRFLESADGEPHHGDARNEYGLDALNKFLEIGNRAFVVRANVNLDDRLESIKALWERKVGDAGDFLAQLIEDYIEEFNAVNNLTIFDPNYKETVTSEELKVILDEALADVFESYSFSSDEFINGFLLNHTIDQPGYQDVIFDTTGGFLQNSDVTGLNNDSTLYGVEVEIQNTVHSLIFQGSDIQTFGDLIDQINAVLGVDGDIAFVGGRLRITSSLDGVTSSVEIITDGPSGTLPLFSSLNLFLNYGTPVPGTGPNPLVTYNDDFTMIEGSYDGLYALIDNWTSGTVVNDEFTSNEAEVLLLSASNEYAKTLEFRSATSLGTNDAARRAEIVERLQAVINSPNTGIRNPDAFNYNILACPGYPETTDELVRLSQDMLEEVFVIGETPFDRPPTGFNGVGVWASSSERVTYPGAAYWYGHGISSNVDGVDIMTSSASTALRVIAFNDQERNLWWAPAGTQRGTCPHLTATGYVSGTLGGPTTFIEDDLDIGARDSLYEFPKNINPITRISGRGILVLGQKTVSPIVSARESINVERLLRFIKREIRRGVFPYLFEPNDQITRNQVKATVDNFLSGLINERALYDFATICDETNNTPDRIDLKELWIDIALKPVRAIEFIIVPIRVVATGADIGTAGSVEASADNNIS